MRITLSAISIILIWIMFNPTPIQACFSPFNMTSPRPIMSIMEARDIIFFVGGGRFDDSPFIDVFDAQENIWRPQIQLPAYLEPIGGATVDSKAIFVGTTRNETYEVFIYDIDSEDMQQIPVTSNITKVLGQSRRWRSISVGPKACFYNYDGHTLVIADVSSNTSLVILNEAGQNPLATTNGTHLIFLDLGGIYLHFLNLETLTWTNEVLHMSVQSPIEMFYVDKDHLIIVEPQYVYLTSLDQNNGYQMWNLREPASTAVVIGEAVYLTSETGASVVYYNTSTKVHFAEKVITVFYRLGSTNIQAHRPLVYNGSIYYTSKLPAVYRMDLQWLFSAVDLKVDNVRDHKMSIAHNGYYIYFNTAASTIHSYELATGHLEIIEQRNFPSTFSSLDTVTLGNILLVLRYPEYDIFDSDSNTWNTSTLPYNISRLRHATNDNYAVFYTQSSANNFYAFNLNERHWMKVDSDTYSYVFIVQDTVVISTLDGKFKRFDIRTRRWQILDFDAPSNIVLVFQYQTGIVIASTGHSTSSLFLYNIFTNQVSTSEVVGPIGRSAQTHGDFIMFMHPMEKSNLQTVRVKIFNVRTFSWHIVDLTPRSINEPAILGINKNEAYVARQGHVEVIDLLTLTVNSIVVPLEIPLQILFAGNKVLFMSGSSSSRTITMYDASTRTSTLVQFNYHAFAFDNFRTTENFLIAMIDDQIKVLQFSALFDAMSDASIFIGQSASFTTQPRGLSFPRAYWKNKYDHQLASGFSLQLSNMSLSDAGPYTVSVFDQCQQGMQQKAQLVVYDKPSFSSSLSDVIALCNDSTTTAVANASTIGEQVEYLWLLDDTRISGGTSEINLDVSNLACQSTHTLCVLAKNPSGTARNCSLLQVLTHESLFDGPRPYTDQALWLSETQVQLRVTLLNSNCTNHRWLVNGASIDVTGTERSELTVQVSTKMENNEYQVEALCFNNWIRSRPYTFTNVTSLTRMGLSLIILGIALIIAVPVVVSIVYRRRLNYSKLQQEDLEMRLSHAKTESIRAKDNITILQPTTWEWIPSDEYTYKAIDSLPFTIDFSAFNSLSKKAIDVDSFMQRDIIFTAKAKPKKGLKMPLMRASHLVDIYVPKSPKYEIIAEPHSFEVSAHGPITVTISSKLRMTTKCSICLILVCEQDSTYSAIEFKLESRPSMWIDIEEVKMTEEFLGGGGFGSVTRGVYRGQDVAVKKLLLQSMPEEIMTEFEREISLMKSLHHPNIIQFVGASNVQNNLAIVIEFAPLGSLASVMKKQRLSQSLKLTVLLETAKALQFLHSNGIVHRDIKPQNILVFSLEPKSAVHVKLTDFGTARFVPESATNVTRNIGTSGYMAPESMGKQPRIAKSADIYSYAILMWEVLFEQQPFEDMQWQSDIEAHVLSGARLPIPSSHNVPPELVQLMEECWQQDPSKRPATTSVAQRIAALI